MRIKFYMINVAMLTTMILIVKAGAWETVDWKGRVRIPRTAEDKGHIRYGNIKIYPLIALEGAYDDNIFLQSGHDDTTNEAIVEDWITQILPALAVEYILPMRGNLRMGYEGDFAFYKDHDENDWQAHDLFLTGDYQAPGGLLARIYNKYSYTEDPYSSPTEFELGAPKIKRRHNNLHATLGWRFRNQLKILGFFNHYQQDYDAEQYFTQDHKNPEFGLGAELRVMPRTWAFGRYHYGQRDYFSHPAGSGSTEANDADFNWHRVNVGLTWDATAKLRGELNFGYFWKLYENEIDEYGNSYKDLDTWIASTQIVYMPLPTTMLTLNIRRIPRHSYSTSNQYYNETGIWLALRQMFNTQIGIDAYAEYYYLDFNSPENDPREDNNYRTNIDLFYKIKDWLSIGTGWRFWQKDSNESLYSFTDNRVRMFIQAEY